MKTFSAKSEEVSRSWFIFDASEHSLGRLAAQIARVLRGKHKPIFTPHVDTGDYIIVINASQVRITGDKLRKKIYHHHTGFIGNMKHESLRHRLTRRPELVIEQAVRGMMPRGPLGRRMLLKLKVYAGDVHPHQAQCPEKFTALL
ncbi:MAG: 50S ribosomal protein L13 [Gammaproteobacteria bacterium]|nr:50S ribosomal protein L13 [Pseudomonadota bacterium]MCH9662699.1 50S ribosomal protein L13 [Gammaproteobacteria bacterium]